MATNRIAYLNTQIVPYHGWNRMLKVIGGPVAITTTDLGTTSDTVALFTVPKGFTITGIVIDNPQLDSNGAPTLIASLGDATLATRLLNASNTLRTANVSNVLPQGVTGFRYPADTDIILTVTAAAATPVAGNLTVYLTGYIDN